MTATAVAVVDDHAVFAEALCAALGVAGLPAASVALDGIGSLVGRVLATGAAVAVVDVDLGHGRSGTELIEPLRRAGLRVLLLTADIGLRPTLVDPGADAVLDKRGSFREVREAVRAHLAPMRRPDWGLSRREAEVLRCLVAGRTAAEIAAERGVALSTVRTHIRGVLAKLGVRSQLAAVAVAREWAD